MTKIKIGDLITERIVNGHLTFEYPVEVNENGEGSISIHLDDEFVKIKFIHHKRIEDVDGFAVIRRYKDYNKINIIPLICGDFYENDDYHLLKLYYYYDRSLKDYFRGEHPEYQELIRFENTEGSSKEVNIANPCKEDGFESEYEDEIEQARKLIRFLSEHHRPLTPNQIAQKIIFNGKSPTEEHVLHLLECLGAVEQTKKGGWRLVKAVSEESS